jgi:alpha-beta hydrolase superfamily lysophospholipase
MRRAMRGLVGLVLVTAAIAGSPARPSAAAAPAPSPVVLAPGQDMYRPPAELVSGPAGSLVWYQQKASTVAGAEAWRILFRSRSADNEPVLVSGDLFRPAGPAPPGGFPVLSWAVGSVGLADVCAPSRRPSFVPELARALQAGFVVVATDGEGLGTRGPAHYLIGASEAHTILDSARAARKMPGARAGHRVGLWGYSSGGHGVLFAAAEAARYAPGLELLGTVAVAPVVDVGRLAGRPGTFPGFTFLTLGGWAKLHRLDPSTVFTDAVIRRLPRLNTECTANYIFDWALWQAQDVVVADPLQTQPWKRLLRQQLAGRSSITGPLLVIQGLADPVVSSEATASMAARLCAFGDTVEHVTLPGQSHDIAYSTGTRAIDWFSARVARTPPLSTC